MVLMPRWNTFGGGRDVNKLSDRCRLYSTSELERGIKLPEDAIFIDKTQRRLVVTLAPIFGFYDPRIAMMIESALAWLDDRT